MTKGFVQAGCIAGLHRPSWKVPEVFKLQQKNIKRIINIYLVL